MKAAHIKAGALALSICTMLSACGAFGPGVEGKVDHKVDNKALAAHRASREGTELYRGKYSFVRLALAEAGAAANQASDITPAQLGNALQALRLASGEAVFLPEELNEINPPLARALTLASGNEDVVFAVTGKHQGMFGPSSVTSGRLFVADGKLNLIFGLVQTDFDIEHQTMQPTKVFLPGSRLRSLPMAAQVAGASWSLAVPGRSDWLVLPVAGIVSAPAPLAAPAAPSFSVPAAPAPAVSEVERRLALNARLRQQGLISEEEYQQKRRVILNDY